MLLPVLELWREKISPYGIWSLFVLDLLCLVIASLDAALEIYFKTLQSEARGTFLRSAPGFHMMLYIVLWVAWIMQQFNIARLAGFIMPLLLFVKHSELRLTVTIFIRSFLHTTSRAA